MAIIQVQIGNNTIEDVLLDGGSKVNIITKQLKLRSRLPKPKLAPYNLRMAYQTTTKLVGLIKDLKIYVHGIPYITTFTILQNSVVDFNCSMLLGKPWLKDTKMAHDWGSNTVTIQGNGTIKTIIVTKHLGGEIRRPKVLLCYDYQIGIINEEEDITFAIKPELFLIGTVSLSETIQFMKTIDVKTIISEQEFEVQNTKKKIVDNRYELEVTLKDKVYLKTYYSHQPRSVTVDETPTKIKAQELQIVRWMLIENQQLMKLNLGTNAEPQMVKINA
jgi:hypothetical protein